MASRPVSDTKATQRIRSKEKADSDAGFVDPSKLNGDELEEFRKGLQANMALAEEDQHWAGEDEPGSPMDTINNHEI